MPDQTENTRERVLSGMRPTGKLHLGNYVGALQNWVKLQHESRYHCFFFVADWHALTTDYADTARVASNTREVFLDWLAAGLDPNKCTMFVQSHVLQHAELQVLFSMVTPLSWLERVPTYKEQQQNLDTKDLNTYGFLGYPLLQAADILIYKAAHVPVGEDQVAHVELTREVARRFNTFFPKGGRSSTYSFGYGASALPSSLSQAVFPEPQPLLTATPKLLGTDKRKMSKSYGNTILLSDSAETIIQKIRGSTTDRPHLSDPGLPENCPVGNLHQIFSDLQVKDKITKGCTTATITCMECKELAIESTERAIAPIRKRRHEWANRPTDVTSLIEEGAVRATEVAESTMREVRGAVGLLRRGIRPKPRIRRAETPPSGIESDSPPYLPIKSLADLSHEARGDLRRETWLRTITRLYPLRDVGHRTFVTRRNRRVGIPTSGDDGSQKWHFRIGDRHYDLLALICHLDSGFFLDFVIPVNRLNNWKSLKRENKQVIFDVWRKNENFVLNSEGSIPETITEFQSNHAALE